MTGPLFPDVGVLGLVPERWGGPWMPRHHVMTRLARYYHVTWVEPARHWRELLGANGHAAGRAFPVTASFGRYDAPAWLPVVLRPDALRRGLEKARLRQAAARLRAAGCRRLVLYVWRPELGGALDDVAHDVSLYHIDDEYTFSDDELPIGSEEAVLLARATQVVVHSPALRDKKDTRDGRTALVPNGVDYGAYATPCPEPADLARIPRPRIGYVGMIKKQLDFALLAALAERHPEWQFVFVGPDGYLGDQAGLRQALAERANVTFLGGKPVPELPAYTQHLDVGLMCYQVTDYTKFIYPLKLHEYLATGLPVVGAPIRTLQDFRHVVDIAATPDEWSAAIARNLDPAARQPERVAARRQAAQSHDWDCLVGRIARLLAERLGPPYADALAERARC